MVEIREYEYPFQKDNTELEVEILNETFTKRC